ncbi:hypothetical protein B1987_24200 [Mycobacterium kansasii]|nr:hypothetical protein B1987_05780 [Mycobacterium kansasii]ORB86362.1 hypothetical protein B1987_24200 [Mycobacterium kansasii]
MAPQQSAGPTGLARAGCPVGAVADQWAAQQCLGRRIHQAQHILLQHLQRRSARGLSGQISTRSRSMP